MTRPPSFSSESIAVLKVSTTDAEYQTKPPPVRPAGASFNPREGFTPYLNLAQSGPLGHAPARQQRRSHTRNYAGRSSGVLGSRSCVVKNNSHYSGLIAFRTNSLNRGMTKRVRSVRFKSGSHAPRAGRDRTAASRGRGPDAA